MKFFKKAQAPRQRESDVLRKLERTRAFIFSMGKKCPWLGDPGEGRGRRMDRGKLNSLKQPVPDPLKALPMLETTVWNIHDYRSERNNLIPSNSGSSGPLGVAEPQARWRLSFLQPHTMGAQGEK